MCKRFIDISEHNTILSLSAIPASNLVGVICKATEGTTFKDHAVDIYYEALNGKIALGFYHFLRKTSQPETQALNFWNTIKDKNYQIIPCVDVESYGDNDELGADAQEYTQRFIQEFRNISGQDVFIYSGRCYIEEHFSYEFCQNNNWWVADYSANEEPRIHGCNVIAWQYTEDERNYAFTIKDLDVSLLLDEEKFFIENNLPYTENTKSYQGTHDIAILQNELIIQGFEDSNGNELIVDGVAGELTLSACPTLKIGTRGNITAWVQTRLHKLLNCDLANDGIFGEMTRQAVIEYQENMSLDGDGIVGKNTWRKLLGM